MTKAIKGWMTTKKSLLLLLLVHHRHDLVRHLPVGVVHHHGRWEGRHLLGQAHLLPVAVPHHLDQQQHPHHRSVQTLRLLWHQERQS
jgi:hypothetical protein